MIILDKKLSNILKEEKREYRGLFMSKRDYLFAKITRDHQILIMKYVLKLRISEYYFNKFKNTNSIVRVVYLLIFSFFRLSKNMLGNKLNIDIRENSLGTRTVIYHPNVIINGHATIGNNCKFHGNNCVGNSGKTGETPIIGNNVDIGYGSSIIGDVVIADNVIIGAGAVVNKSIVSSGTYVGIPARKVKYENVD